MICGVVALRGTLIKYWGITQWSVFFGSLFFCFGSSNQTFFSCDRKRMRQFGYFFSIRMTFISQHLICVFFLHLLLFQWKYFIINVWIPNASPCDVTINHISCSIKVRNVLVSTRLVGAMLKVVTATQISILICIHLIQLAFFPFMLVGKWWWWWWWSLELVDQWDNIAVFFFAVVLHHANETSQLLCRAYHR